MATVGPQYPTTAANNTGTGTVAWSNVNNALVLDTANATVAPGASTSNYLWLTGFDFSAIGDSDTIDAILVQVTRSSNANNRISDNILRLIVGGAVAGNNKAAAGNWASTETTVDYGDLTSDKWGLSSPVGSDVKSNFGIAFSLNGNAGWLGQVNTIAITVAYTPTAGGVEVATVTAVLELAPQAVTIDLGTPPGVDVEIATPVVLEAAPQAVTIDLGTPSGVNVVANVATLELAPQAVSIDLGTPPAGVNIDVNVAVLELSARPVTIQAPGAALLIGVPDPITLSVISTNAVDHTARTLSHAVEHSSNPGAQAILLSTTDNGYLRLVRLGLGKDPTYPLDIEGDIQLTGYLRHTADLNIEATGGDVLLRDTDMQAHDWVSGTTGWGIQHDGDADFRNITADSLTVEAFIADINLALAGSQFITKSLAIVARPFTVPGASETLYVYDLPGFANTQVFEDGDYVRLRYIDRSGGGLVVGDAWGTVSSYADLTGGEQSWTWTYVSGSIGQIIGEGGTALDYGASGDGYWHVTTLDAAGSPYAEIGTWITDPSSGANHTIHLRMGQLDGITGIGDEWGLWAGQDTDIYLLLSDSNFEAHGLRLSLYDSDSNEAIRLDPNTPYLAIGQPLPSGPDAGGDGLWVGNEGGSYKLRLGKASGTALRWDGSSLKIRNSSNADVIVIDNAGESYFAGVMTLGTGGGIYQGTGSFGVPTTGLKLWREGSIGRIAGYNAGTLQWYAGTDGKLYAGAGKVLLDQNGVALKNSIGFSDSTNLQWFGTSDDEIAFLGAAEEESGGSRNDMALKVTNSSTYNDSRLTLLAGGSILPSADSIIELTATKGSPNASNVRFLINSVEVFKIRNDGIYKNGITINPMHYLTAALTSTSWDGNSHSDVSTSTVIDLSAAFGAPAGITAVLLKIAVRDSASFPTNNLYFTAGPSSGNPFAMEVPAFGGDILNRWQGVIPCDANGDIWYQINASGTNTLDVWIEIWGYAL